MLVGAVQLLSWLENGRKKQGVLHRRLGRLPSRPTLLRSFACGASRSGSRDDSNVLEQLLNPLRSRIGQCEEGPGERSRDASDLETNALRSQQRKGARLPNEGT